MLRFMTGRGRSSKQAKSIAFEVSMSALRAKKSSRETRAEPVEDRAKPRWVLLMPNIPSRPSYLRVKIWRRLQTIGAVAIKNSVYALPNREECVEVFQWVAREIVELGGQASLCESRFFDDATDDEIERKLVDDRNADYASLANDVRALAKSLKPKRLSPETLASIDAQFAKLKRRLDEIVAIDFGHASGREPIEGLVAELAAAIASRRGAEPTADALAPMPRPEQATWVTRAGVHVDRIASTWLIRRFIDPRAKLKFVPAKGYVPRPGELRFDMYEAEFTHVGDRCTFEVLLERMGLDDPALRAIADIVHDIDLRDDKYARKETVGVRSALNGLCASCRADDDRIAQGTVLLNSLYAFFSMQHRGS
jgi:hypothetical protein